MLSRHENIKQMSTNLEDLFSLTNILIIISVALISLAIQRTKRAQNLTPGPWGLPILGHVPFMEKHAERTLGKWADKYGPVMFVRLGMQPTVVLSNYEAVEMAFVKQSSRFIGRYCSSFSKIMTEGSGILFLQNLKQWHVCRRFGLKAIGNAGQIGNNLESIVCEEANQFCQKMKDKAGTPLIVERDLVFAIANVVSGITVTEKPTNTKYKSLEKIFIQSIEQFREDGFAFMLFATFPWFRFLPPFWKSFQRTLDLKQSGDAYMEEIIEDRLKEYDPNHPRDMTDFYLTEMKENKFGFDKDHLRCLMKDLHVAGTETGSSTVRWTLMYLLKYPKYQDLIHEEIDEVIGKEGKVTHSAPLHITKAFIQEVYRCHPVVLLGVPRQTVEDATLMGYHIPKGTQVLANFWKVHRDETKWTNPNVFDPKRHLTSEGKFIKSPYVIPFSIGPRNCLGENLGRIEVFVFVVTILQRFTLCPDPEHPVPSMEAAFGAISGPKHYRMVFEER